ncbi:FMN-dependent alpha-hydroxy acid dehydrogenase [Rhizoctonia solani]|uniref:FMN-dependent alpha-hydroxy acid dehydrogenase n=1 Tax=Rhizoctonia solani TaxID=456999 RepID=A0A8H8NZI6_9AGAM|nr:FMN-dependent alpha-hydroxy acid dehydrogenase [Rhizoctonia solani]QRW21201.1 FMN-dependent alpha-hydroxy acid dehydrogenase [Rhizoctonia solani]
MRFEALISSALSATLYTSLAAAVVLDTEGLPETGLNTSSWVAGVKPPLEDMFSLHDMQLAAKNFLGGTQYAFIRTGSLDEHTYHANLDIWKQIKLRPHQSHGRDVANASTEQTIFGTKFSVPFFIAPVAYSSYTDPENGELNLVRAAGKQGALRGNIGTLYPLVNRTRLLEQLAEAEATGYKAIFLTVDNPTIQGIRTRARRVGAPDASGTYSTDRSLESVVELQKLTKLPIIPKGIVSWEDAKKCLDLGFKAIYVSNHGGRLIDTAPTAVLASMEVYADGGVRHGTDIAKLLALGVKAVGIGRSAVFSNSWGEEGVEKFFNLLKTELTTTMKLLGVSEISQLDRTYVNTKAIENAIF